MKLWDEDNETPESGDSDGDGQSEDVSSDEAWAEAHEDLIEENS